MIPFNHNIFLSDPNIFVLINNLTLICHSMLNRLIMTYWLFVYMLIDWWFMIKNYQNISSGGSSEKNVKLGIIGVIGQSLIIVVVPLSIMIWLIFLIDKIMMLITYKTLLIVLPIKKQRWRIETLTDKLTAPQNISHFQLQFHQILSKQQISIDCINKQYVAGLHQHFPIMLKYF